MKTAAKEKPFILLEIANRVGKLEEVAAKQAIGFVASAGDSQDEI